MKTPEERFHEKYVPDPNSGCWHWISAMSGGKKKGYPAIHLNKKKTLAHRYSYELHVGPIPDGLYVLHKCDTPLCVNPNHLFLGTHKDNMEDMTRKGRSQDQKGEKNNRKKLNEADIINIRAIYKYCDVTHQRLADIYNVSRRTIGKIIDGTRWYHVQTS